MSIDFIYGYHLHKDALEHLCDFVLDDDRKQDIFDTKWYDDFEYWLDDLAYDNIIVNYRTNDDSNDSIMFGIRIKEFNFGFQGHTDVPMLTGEEVQELDRRLLVVEEKYPMLPRFYKKGMWAFCFSTH